MWVYGQTRLLDYYEGRLSLRELANRLLALPHEAPLWRFLEEQQEKAEAEAQVSDIENVLATFQKG